jgi:hypothetical protein
LRPLTKLIIHQVLSLNSMTNQYEIVYGVGSGTLLVRTSVSGRASGRQCEHHIPGQMVEWPCSSYQTQKFVRIRDRKLGTLYVRRSRFFLPPHTTPHQS